MFLRKTQMSFAIIILAATTHISDASMQQLDSIGSMPEITVTASRYEYQDDAWLGMVEGVVVEAQRPSSSINTANAGDKSRATVSGSMSSKDMEYPSMGFRDSVGLLVSLTLTLATLSILYISLGAYFAAREVK